MQWWAKYWRCKGHASRRDSSSVSLHGLVSAAGAVPLLLVKGIVALECHHPYHCVGLPCTPNLFCW